MNNPEKWATFGLQDTEWRQTKQKYNNTDNYNDEQHGPNQNPGVKGKQFLWFIRHQPCYSDFC
jgi:hypothetical protein